MNLREIEMNIGFLNLFFSTVNINNIKNHYITDIYYLIIFYWSLLMIQGGEEIPTEFVAAFGARAAAAPCAPSALDFWIVKDREVDVIRN